MTCHECELALAGEESNVLVDRHLAACATCRELAEEMRANSVAFDSMSTESFSFRPRKRIRWDWALAAAAMLLAMFGMSRIWQVENVEKITPPVIAFVPPKIEIPPALPSRPRKPVRPQESSPLTVKMLTSDPDVVIYWLIETKEGTEE